MSGGRNSMLDVSSSTAPHLQCWMCRWVSRWTWNSSARSDGVIAELHGSACLPIAGATVLGSGGCWGLSPGPWAGRASALPAEPAPRSNRDGKAHTSDLPSVIKIFFFNLKSHWRRDMSVFSVLLAMYPSRKPHNSLWLQNWCFFLKNCPVNARRFLKCE